MKTYTQEQIDEMKAEWVKQELDPLKAKIAELEQYKPVEKTDEEKALETKAAELWQKEVDLTLREHGLQEFAEFIVANDEKELTKKVESLKAILTKKGLDGSFKPGSHKSTDKYSLAESKKDTTGMIASKLSSLFKN